MLMSLWFYDKTKLSGAVLVLLGYPLEHLAPATGFSGYDEELNMTITV